jgi:hypothetical protein
VLLDHVPEDGGPVVFEAVVYWPACHCQAGDIPPGGRRLAELVEDIQEDLVRDIVEFDWADNGVRRQCEGLLGFCRHGDKFLVMLSTMNDEYSRFQERSDESYISSE